MSGWQYTPTSGDLMNRYAVQISDRWMRLAPARYAQLENPELYFAELGELVLNQVDELARILPAATAEADETYLDTVARLNAVRREAVEIAMGELEWPEVELSLDDHRTEWESTSPREDWLPEWASSLEETPGEDELEALSAEWILPVEYLRSLATSTNPWTYSSENAETIAESREARYQRYLRS